MRDDLPRFPTPSEAFGGKKASTKSPAYGDLGNIPSLPTQRRRDTSSPVSQYAPAPSRPPAQAGPVPQQRNGSGGYSRQKAQLPSQTHEQDPQRAYGQAPQGYYQGSQPSFHSAPRNNYAPQQPQQQSSQQQAYYSHHQPSGQPRSQSQPQLPPQPQHHRPRVTPPQQLASPTSQQRQQSIPQSQRGPTAMPQPPQPQAPPQPRQPRDDLRALFDSVDRNKTGYLTEAELSSALVNGDYSRFDPNTVRVMIRMFDRDNDGALHFREFGQLWKYLHEWRKIFDQFDTNASEAITVDEFSAALAAFGYKLMPECVQFVFATGSRVNKSTGIREMSFDMFVKSCINIKSITDTFKKYDSDRDGFVTMSFEDFLTEVTKLVT
ncbi:Programmed cell death protein 6 [Wickerhamiella sorbophila]|uniref:Programmed cell death protein 6 n=1 Tax=Wickerhamiella sorbophila TaxID=45607 RepID=A0A2T0FFS2_9ASCO|nr:Programmed cell death protein 6 [Wickerhamiella sorbophila]PRT53835.1 Programmed cell death protein 6 [Wickerhamiella sorbophila]